jgi:eukaryotic translation initiation factor 2C
MFLVQSTTFKNPKITYRNTSFAMDASAQWDLADCQFLSTGSSAKAVADIPYAIIHDKWAEGDHIKAIQSNLERQMSGRGVGQARCLGTVSIHLNKKDNAEGPLRTRLREARKLGVDLVILVLQNKDQEFYSVFKFLADRVFGLQSMMFVTKSNFRKGSWNPTGVDQYVGNIMMKVNLKFGGINHSAETNGAKHGKISEFLSNTLVLGADVTHPSGGALPGCPSIAAVVGSVENTGGKFLGSIRLQGEANKEVCSGPCIRY